MELIYWELGPMENLLSGSLGAVVGAAIALLGVWFQNRYQEKAREQDLERQAALAADVLSGEMEFMLEHLAQLYERLKAKNDWNHASEFEDLKSYEFPANLDATEPLSISDFGNLDRRFLHRLGVVRSRMVDIRVRGASLIDRLVEFRNLIGTGEQGKMEKNYETITEKIKDDIVKAGELYWLLRRYCNPNHEYWPMENIIDKPKPNGLKYFGSRYTKGLN
jgi:hypothetical protein